MRIIVVREELHANAFDLIGTGNIAGIDRTWWISSNNLNIGILRFEVSASSRNSSACSNPSDKGCNPSIGIPPDLWPRGPIMRLRVCGIGILVGTTGTGNLLSQFMCNVFVVFRRIVRDASWTDYDFCTIRPQQTAFLFTHFVSHDEYAMIAFQ